MADIVERLRKPFWKDDAKGGVINMAVVEAVEDDMAEAADRIEQLENGIRKLHWVWWTKGVDLDKDAIAQECLKLFALLPEKE